MAINHVGNKKIWASLAFCGLALLAGCTEAPKKAVERYPMLTPREVPDYLKDSILQYTDLSGNEPFAVSGYGLVTHLHGTGGSRVATPVRAMMLKELARRGLGDIGNGLPTPEAFLASKDVAIVRVDGFIPVGARSALDHGADATGAEWEEKHNPSDARTAFGSDSGSSADWCTWFDVRVSIPPESDATSLAHGVLYQADLKQGGANPADPGGGRVEVEAQAMGDIFVNPSYVLNTSIDSAASRFSLKSGVILAGSRVLKDRPLILRLRSPGARQARAIEQRIIERFQEDVDDDLRSASGADGASSKKVANASDEGVVWVYVPRDYTNDVDRFIGVMRHLYMQGGNPAFAAQKARELAVAAVQKGAPLADISYCWEGLGKSALFAITPLMSSPDPDVQFAAARAAVFLGDRSATQVLLDIANTPGNRFRVTAVRTLAELPATPRVDRLCRTLLDSDEAQVRIEAYQMLVKHKDSTVYTRWIKNGTREKFALDLVQSSGRPLIWASREGVPRLAVFGNMTQLELPLMFTAMDSKLTISTEEEGSTVTIFYRGEELPKPATVLCSPSLPQIVAELAGDTNGAGANGLRFGYADIVGILQQMVDERKISGAHGEGRLLAAFMLQGERQDIAPPTGKHGNPQDGPRPINDDPGANDKPVDGHPLLRAGAMGLATPGGKTAN